MRAAHQRVYASQVLADLADPCLLKNTPVPPLTGGGGSPCRALMIRAQIWLPGIWFFSGEKRLRQCSQPLGASRNSLGHFGDIFLNFFGGWGPRYATRVGVVCELTRIEIICEYLTY